ncbi:MAG: hypothetical protein LBR79_05785 [Oscillospiraceae bacterium]|nr:hypothetical protein [Oscillospiraceae bacterium]
MNIQEVLERFSIIAGLKTDQAAPWAALCSESIEEITSHVKEGIDTESNSRRLGAAAAALAFYKYALYRASSGGLESFKAGDVSVKSDTKASLQIAFAVWRDARSSVSDLLNDEEFVFERIGSV